MKVPVEWLREFVTTSLDDDGLADALTMAGLEIEETTAGPSGPVYHTKVTPNRGDWLSVVGTAREAAAALNSPCLWQSPTLPTESDDVTKWAGVRVLNPDLCPRYAGKVIRNVQITSSPQWMQDRLTAAGMRPLNVVVDITNYVMLELGQPLHAFDYDKLPGGEIVVRTARAGEEITTLDGVKRTLTPDMLAICDRDHPIVIAGVFGSEDVEVSAETRNIFLEAAHFDAGSIRRTSKAIGLPTEASYRFERFVDPELVPVALERASDLLADLAGGEVVLGRIDLYPEPAKPRTIALRPDRTNAILGTALDTETIADAMTRLGLEVGPGMNSLQVTIPTFRPDLVKEIDLIEEVGRMVSYETLDETLPVSRSQGGEEAPSQFADRLRDLVAGFGLAEALTNTMVGVTVFDSEAEIAHRVTVRSALSAELSGLRMNLVPNLLDSLASNLRRREPNVRLFEVGKVWRKASASGGYHEGRHIAAVLTGASAPSSLDTPNPPPADFYTAKGLVEAILAALRIPDVAFRSGTHAGMHPGRCARVHAGEREIGYVAEVEPGLMASAMNAPNNTGRVAVFELDSEALLELAPQDYTFRALPRFPAVHRDIAVSVDRAVPYQAIESAIRSSASAGLLAGIALQSVYTGERIAADKKSVAVRLTFQASDRTLTEAEIEEQLVAIREALAAQAGAEQR